jgi:hypothetical protein
MVCTISHPLNHHHHYHHLQASFPSMSLRAIYPPRCMFTWRMRRSTNRVIKRRLHNNNIIPHLRIILQRVAHAATTIRHVRAIIANHRDAPSRHHRRRRRRRHVCRQHSPQHDARSRDDRWRKALTICDSKLGSLSTVDVNNKRKLRESPRFQIASEQSIYPVQLMRLQERERGLPIDAHAQNVVMVLNTCTFVKQELAGYIKPWSCHFPTFSRRPRLATYLLVQ